MISERKFQNVTIALIFATILHLASYSSANSNTNSKYHQIRQNQLNRLKRSVDEYYDSVMPDLYQPYLKEHTFLRSAAKRAAAMGVDLPDYILHYKGNNWPNLGSFREKMKQSGK